jgi:cytoskeletal protein RodZ
MSGSNNQMVIVGLAAAASVSMLFYFYSQQQKQSEKSLEKTVGSEKHTTSTEIPKSRSVQAPAATSSSTTDNTTASGTSTPPRSKMDAPEINANDKTPKVKNTISKSDEKNLHSQIEELDKKGKVLFKNKQVRD